jgi:hypothetical protein
MPDCQFSHLLFAEAEATRLDFIDQILHGLCSAVVEKKTQRVGIVEIHGQSQCSATRPIKNIALGLILVVLIRRAASHDAA